MSWTYSRDVHIYSIWYSYVMSNVFYIDFICLGNLFCVRMGVRIQYVRKLYGVLQQKGSVPCPLLDALSKAVKVHRVPRTYRAF